MENQVINTDAVNDEEKTPEQLWESFWKDIVCNPDGSINLEQLKKELWDFSFILGEVPKVYMGVTGGSLSKPNYHAAGVIDAANEYYKTYYSDGAKEMLQELIDSGELKLEEGKSIQEVINDNF